MKGLKLIRNASYSVMVSLFERPDGSLIELVQSSNGDFYWYESGQASEEDGRPFDREKYLKDWDTNAVQQGAGGFGHAAENWKNRKGADHD